VTLTAWEATARRFEAGPGPRWQTPLELGAYLDRRIRTTRPLAMIDEMMADAITGKTDRVIGVLPPQEGKTVCARYAALLALHRNPELQIGVCSYGDRLARRIPRWCRNDIRGFPQLGLRLAPDQKAAHDWKLDNGIGGMYAAGYSGGWSGNPLDLLIVDDVFKDHRDAESEATREAVWDWWTSAATARFGEGSSVIIINTRWHHDDLIGRILKTDDTGEWRMVHIPAQADPKVIENDPLGRAPGQFMESVRGRTPTSWERRKKTADDKWEAEYQGNPGSPGGDSFDVSKLRYWHPTRDGSALVCGPRTWRIREDSYRYVTIDLAESVKAGADFTVASAWAIVTDGSLVLLDVARGRVPQHKQFELARPLVERWSADTVYIESNMRGTQLVREAVAEGWRVDDLIADKSKVVRAAPAGRKVEQGRIWFPAEHPELGEFLKEMREFPNSRHDDMVDTLAYAVRVLFMDYITPGIGAKYQPPQRHVSDVATDLPRGFDAMRADF
jgi:predicted phage terminase large subunit-like protein